MTDKAQHEALRLADELANWARNYAQTSYTASMAERASALLRTIPDLEAELTALRAQVGRVPEVSTQGIRFGDAWFSHEKITGYTANKLNSGDCSLTARLYMKWVLGALSSTPTAPQSPAWQGIEPDAANELSDATWGDPDEPFIAWGPGGKLYRFDFPKITTSEGGGS